MSNAITLSLAAQKRVQALKAKPGNEALALRVYITGGGCAGFQYGFGFEQAPGADDNQLDFCLEASGDTVTLVIDPLSYPYLLGAEIDFERGLYGAHFKVTNPNARSTCGCGASFSLFDAE